MTHLIVVSNQNAAGTGWVDTVLFGPATQKECEKRILHLWKNRVNARLVGVSK